MSYIPRNRDMTHWLYTLEAALVVSGGFRDELEVVWLRECLTQSYEELDCWDRSVGEPDCVGWKTGWTCLYSKHSRELSSQAENHIQKTSRWKPANVISGASFCMEGEVSGWWLLISKQIDVCKSNIHGRLLIYYSGLVANIWNLSSVNGIF